MNSTQASISSQMHPQALPAAVPAHLLLEQLCPRALHLLSLHLTAAKPEIFTNGSCVSSGASENSALRLFTCQGLTLRNSKILLKCTIFYLLYHSAMAWGWGMHKVTREGKLSRLGLFLHCERENVGAVQSSHLSLLRMQETKKSFI